MHGEWIRKPQGTASAVFVHGILSSGEKCWRHDNGCYWPELLKDEPALRSLGIYVFTYQTNIFSGDYSLSKIVDALREEMQQDRVLESSRLVFVCHSMGGIVVRKFLVDRATELIDQGKKVSLFLIASPSLGSSYAGWLQLLARWFGHKQAAGLRVVRNNAWLEDLDKNFINLKEAGKLTINGKELVEDKFINWTNAGKQLEGEEPVEDRFVVLRWFKLLARRTAFALMTLSRKQVVEAHSAARYFADQYTVPESDHFSIAKPKDKNEPQHCSLRKFILETVLSPDLEAEKCPGYVWLPDDQPPKTVEEGPVLIGTRVRVSDLREGYFAYRPIFDELSRKATQWIEAARSGPDARRKLSLFWIGGRSGTGKSIALLHVLATLHAQDKNRVIVWLDNNIDSLPDCIHWARPALEGGWQVLIGVDDPFPVDREDDLARILPSVLRELSGLQGQRSFCFPLIVCCGTTEQRLSFREQFEDLAAIANVELEKETAKDREALWDWYQRRSGKKLPQPYAPDQDVLLVQLFFEWQTGEPIGDFAIRFRQRLQGLDRSREKIFERFLYSLFAVNRLDANYPTELIEIDREDAAFQRAFRLLHEQESHLKIDEESKRPGVKIAHPHLANAIYETWFRDPFYEPDRRAHLQTVILRSLTDCSEPSDKLRVLWAIAGLAVDEAVRLQLESATIVTLLQDVTKKMQGGFRVLPVYLFPVLIELQALHPSTKFAFSPLGKACDVLDHQMVNETVFRLLCHKVLQHHQALRKVDAAATQHAVESIGAVLRHKTSWDEWPHIALDYLKTIADHSIDPLIGDWIRLHFDHWRTPFFIQDIVIYTRSDDVINAAIAWLNWVDPSISVVPYVMQALLPNCKGNEPLCSLADSWLDEQDRNESSWTFVWEALVRALPSRTSLLECVRAKGKDWLDNNEQRDQHPSWPGVLALLIERTPGDTELGQKGWAWLNEVSFDHGAWTFIWEALEKTTRQEWENRDALISIGKQWLVKNSAGKSHRAYPGVLAHLIEALPDDSSLLKKGWKWVRSTDFGNPSWGWVWCAIEGTSRRVRPKHRKVLLGDGIEWLKSVQPTDLGWTYVWIQISEQAAELGPNVVTVTQLGRDWFALHREPAAQRPSAWPNVLGRLVSLVPNDTELREAAWGWLQSAGIEHGAGPVVWGTLLDTTDDGWPHRDSLLVMGQQWFVAHQTDYEAGPWPRIVSRLVQEFPDNTELREAAWGWLQSAGIEHGAGPVVWGTLLDTTDDGWPHRDSLLVMGRQWFVAHQTDYEAGPWPRIVSGLVREFPDNTELREAAWGWLQSAGIEHGAGPVVWGTLLDTTDDGWPHRDSLLVMGQQWFVAHQTDYEAGPWPSIVSRLVREFPDNTELREAAWGWLQSIDPKHGKGFYLWHALYLTEELATDRSNELGRLGAKWIMQCRFADPFFGKNWEAIFESGERGGAFLDLGFEWAKDRINEESPSFILPKLFAVTRFDDYFYELIGWLKTNDITAELYAEKLIVVLKALQLRTEAIDNELFARAFDGLCRLDFAHRLWGAIWVRLYEERAPTADLIVLGQKWIQPIHDPDTWASVWDRLADQLGLENLIEPAAKWLDVVHKGHNKWSKVWMRLWKATGDCQKLGPLALQWLQYNRPWPKQRNVWREIWLTLWNAGCDQDELQRLKKRRPSSQRGIE